MSDSANGDDYSWLRAPASDPAGDTGANDTSDGAAPDDDTLRFAAPGGLPVMPRYGASDGANGGASAANEILVKNSMAPSLAPAAESVAAPDSAVSDLPTVRVSAAPLPAPVAPSVSDLPTTRMPNADGANAPTTVQDVSDLPTQRVKVTLPPVAGQAIPAAPTTPTTPTTTRRPRTWLVLATAIVLGSLVGLSVTLLTVALRSAPSAATTTGVYQQSLTVAAAGWPNSGACQFTPQGYEISGPSACFYDGQVVSDATVSVIMIRASGGSDLSAGIAFRRADAGAFYTFEIDGGGDWAIYKRGTVQQQGVSIAIKTDAGAKNTLQVKMNGSHFTFAINGMQVAQADDAEFAAGAVGLTGYTGLKVVYTDFTITPLT
jgi:hypothetical protein